MIISRKFCALCIFFLVESCAVLHHAQIGEIDNREGFHKKRIDIKVSELGFSVEEAASIIDSVSKSKAKEAGQFSDVISMFQMGPRTGKPIYNDTYARNVGAQLLASCPTGTITGLTSIRETRSYPAISGEIVKFTGYCLTPKDSK